MEEANAISFSYTVQIVRYVVMLNHHSMTQFSKAGRDNDVFPTNGIVSK